MNQPAFDAVQFARVRAPEWYPDFAGCSTELTTLWSQHRAGVSVVIIGIAGGGSAHEVVVKHYHPARTVDYESRPRLGLPGDAAVKPRLEYQGLLDLHRVYRESAHRDSSLKVSPIVPLDFLPDHDVIVTERFQGVDAREALRRGGDLSLEIATSGGAAMAVAHRSLERPDNVRLDSNDAIEAAFEEFAHYVGAGLHDSNLCRKVESWWRAHPLVGVPERGPCHADCAPRNLMWDVGVNVSWIDGLFRSAAPVHWDVALFISSCRVAARMSPSGRRRARANAVEISTAFLDGYRSQAPISSDWLHRFEVLVLLDRLASTLTQTRRWRTRIVQRLVEAELSAIVDGE